MRELGEAEVNRIMQKFQQNRPGFSQPRKHFADYQDFKRFILVDDFDGVKIITLRRPQAMNALNDELTGEIQSVFNFEYIIVSACDMVKIRIPKLYIDR